jgi:uroporphyrinogen-III synthase
LRDALRARGADVLELEVYRRAVASPTATATERLHLALSSAGLLVVAVTSAEVLQSLLDQVAGDEAARLRSRTLLVPGPRVAAAAVQLGWTGPVVEAATAEDEAMLDALRGLATGPAPPA